MSMTGTEADGASARRVPFQRNRLRFWNGLSIYIPNRDGEWAWPNWARPVESSQGLNVGARHAWSRSRYTVCEDLAYVHFAGRRLAPPERPTMMRECLSADCHQLSTSIARIETRCGSSSTSICPNEPHQFVADARINEPKAA